MSTTAKVIDQDWTAGVTTLLVENCDGVEYKVLCEGDTYYTEGDDILPAYIVEACVKAMYDFVATT